MKQDISAESIRGALAISGTVASTLTLNEWVAIGTGVYIVVQAAYLLRKWWREEQAWQKRIDAEFPDGD